MRGSSWIPTAIRLSFSSLLAIEEPWELRGFRKYTDDTHSFVSYASLQDPAERPVPCKYNVIQLARALSRRKRGFESLRGRHAFNELRAKALGYIYRTSILHCQDCRLVRKLALHGLFGLRCWKAITAQDLFSGSDQRFLTSALSRHFQEVLGMDGQPEEYEVIRRNQFSKGGVVQLVRTPVTQEAAGSCPVAPASFAITNHRSQNRAQPWASGSIRWQSTKVPPTDFAAIHRHLDTTCSHCVDACPLAG
jgi:hypothetical protein